MIPSSVVLCCSARLGLSFYSLPRGQLITLGYRLLLDRFLCVVVRYFPPPCTTSISATMGPIRGTAVSSRSLNLPKFVVFSRCSGGRISADGFSSLSPGWLDNVHCLAAARILFSSMEQSPLKSQTYTTVDRASSCNLCYSQCYVSQRREVRSSACSS